MDLIWQSKIQMEAMALQCKWYPYQRGDRALSVAAEVARLSPSLVCLPVGFPTALPLAVLNPANLSRVLVVGFGRKNEKYTWDCLPFCAHQAARAGLFDVAPGVVERWLAGDWDSPFLTSQQINCSKQEWKEFLPLLKT
jgi:hypothetical protein